MEKKDEVVLIMVACAEWAEVSAGARMVLWLYRRSTRGVLLVTKAWRSEVGGLWLRIAEETVCSVEKYGNGGISWEELMMRG